MNDFESIEKDREENTFRIGRKVLDKPSMMQQARMRGFEGDAFGIFRFEDAYAFLKNRGVRIKKLFNGRVVK